MPRDVHGRRARRAARPPRPGRDPRRRRDAPRGAPRRELLRLRQVRRRAKPAVAPRPSRRRRSQSATRCKKQHDRTSSRRYVAAQVRTARTAERRYVAAPPVGSIRGGRHKHILAAVHPVPLRSASQPATAGEDPACVSLVEEAFPPRATKGGFF
mmetsp:Transcript_19594/g.61366  ORF Transcript_19594/g.61366 Transcript_19594/m.61366 type:complete len:155 (+) Transcript_19594:1184-1648(+)